MDVPSIDLPPVLQLPQQLPLTAQWCVQRQLCIALEVARSPEEQRRGLMQRPPLPPLRGMWFPFKNPRPLRFWMLNTLAPLDMIFVLGQTVVEIQPRVPVCPGLPCPSYGPRQLADGVVELAAGEAERLGISAGDPALFSTIP